MTLPHLTGMTTDLRTAAAAIGIAQSTAYKLAAAGEFPCKVIRVGTRPRATRYLVVTADLRRLLEIDD